MDRASLAGVRSFSWEVGLVVLEKLRRGEGFTRAERRLADYLLAQGSAIRGWSVQRLAEEAESSPATIVRFCKQLGFSGYREFVPAFLAEVERSMRTSHVNANLPFGRDDTPEQVAWRLGNLAAGAINDCITGFDYEQVGRVVGWLATADVINLFAVGTSVPALLDFRTKLMRLGRQVNVDQDTMLQRAFAVSAGPHSCSLFVSQSGETEPIVSYARILASRGRRTVAVTGNLQSRLALACDEAIGTTSGESDSYSHKLETFASFDATHFVLDCLYAWLFQRDFDANIAHARRSQELLVRMTSDSR